ncbi:MULTISPECIES: ABC transporter permease [Sphingomonadales]|nr:MULTISPECIES: ABC transporter permease [Sphingomonas]MDX3884656.1 ABC transporter permease [Sphingomonas sp.]OHT19299.1 putative aliphatic sulfonates transport permease protein SsuC [Sphingomonas haloaromaticamans]
MNSLLARFPVRLLIGLAAPALLIGWWQWQASAHIVSFAPPAAVGSALVEMLRSGDLLRDTLSTLARAFTGLAIGAPLGVALGIAMGIWKPVDRVLGPLLHALRQVPMIGWLPLMGLWFGVGEGTELIVVSMSAFFPSMLNSHAGVAEVERRYLEVGSILRFGTVQRIRFILLPAAMPLVLTGITQALAFAWIATIGTELLTGAGSGLGVAMGQAQMQQRLDVMLVVIGATAALGFVINHLFRRLRRSALRWQPSLP